MDFDSVQEGEEELVPLEQLCAHGIGCLQKEMRKTSAWIAKVISIVTVPPVAIGVMTSDFETAVAIFTATIFGFIVTLSSIEATHDQFLERIGSLRTAIREALHELNVCPDEIRKYLSPHQERLFTEVISLRNPMLKKEELQEEGIPKE